MNKQQSTKVLDLYASVYGFTVFLAVEILHGLFFLFDTHTLGHSITGETSYLALKLLYLSKLFCTLNIQALTLKVIQTYSVFK